MLGNLCKPIPDPGQPLVTGGLDPRIILPLPGPAELPPAPTSEIVNRAPTEREKHGVNFMRSLFCYVNGTWHFLLFLVWNFLTTLVAYPPLLYPSEPLKG